MSSLLIKHKIWIGCSVLLTLLMINSAISVYNLMGTQSTINTVIEKSQPLVLAAHQFNTRLALASGALGNYLLTKSDKQRQDYQNEMWEASEALTQMLAMESVQQSEYLSSKIADIQVKLSQFQSYEQRILKLAKDRVANQTALAYASENINPQANSILSSLSNMIVSEDEEEVSAERRGWINLIHEVRYNFQKMMSTVRLYLSEPDASTLENLLAAQEIIVSLVSRFDEFEELYTFEQEEGVQQVKESQALYSSNLKVMIQKNQSKQRRMDVYLLDEEILPLLALAQDQISELVYEETKVMKSSSQALLSSVDTGLKAQVSLTLVALILGIVVAFVIIKIITLPLNKTVAALADVAQGEGDLTRRLEVKNQDELGQLADAFNQFSEKLQSLMQEVSQGCSELIEESSEMATVVNNTQSDIANQDEKIDQIANTIDSMSLEIQSVAEHTGQAAELAEQTSQHAADGKRIMHQSLQSSDDLANDVDKASSVINELEKDVESISGVLDVIRGIAEQTNLLALNAAIEAARAGEQGRGFAVVADEVRTLASRTQDSTAEIQVMIKSLQDGSHQAVEVMTEGRQKANEGLEQAREAGESLEQISSAVDGMLSMNREIAVSTDQQGQSANQVNQNVSAINQLSDKTTASAGQIADASTRVNQLSQQLQKLIHQFKV